jgi:hypothetical protein
MSFRASPTGPRRLHAVGRWITTVAAAAALVLGGTTAASAASTQNNGKAAATAKSAAGTRTDKSSTSSKTSTSSSKAKPKVNVSIPEQPDLAGHFVPTAPTRLLDTRKGIGGVSSPVGQKPVLLDVSHVTGDPSITPVAVVLNVTVTESTSNSSLAVMPTDFGGTPGTSNLNFTVGETRANQVTVPVGPDGKIAFVTAVGTVEVVADLAGYYTPDAAGAAYVADGPLRLLDTRKGTGTGGVVAPVGIGKTLKLQIGGADGVPAKGLQAATINLTAVDSTGSGYLTAYPDGQPIPDASSLNFGKGQITPNLLTVKVGADGAVDFTNSSTGTVDLVVDLSGYYLTGSAPTGGVLQVTGPTRLLDTRVGTGAPKAKIAANGYLSLQIDGAGGIPATGVTAVILNVTVTNTAGTGYVTAYPAGGTLPTASTVNFVAGQTVPNLAVVPVGADGKVEFHNSSTGVTDLVADVFGYFSTSQDLQLTSLSFATPTVDASAGGASDTATWTIADTDANATGLYGEVVFRQLGSGPNSYLGQPYIEDFQLGESYQNSATFVSGTIASSTYSFQFAVPDYSGSTSATWAITMVAAGDDQGQQLNLAGSDLSGFGNTVTATELASTTTPAMDNTGVTLQSPVTSAPGLLYDGVDNAVEYQLWPSDAESGFWRGTLQLTGPGGATLSASFDIMDDEGQASGDCQNFGNRIWAQDAECTFGVDFPADSAAGTWVVSAVTLTNNAGQTNTLSGLSEAPVTVSWNHTVSASGFAASSSTVDNWAQNATFSVSMAVSGAQGGVPSIQLVWSNTGGLCRQTSTAPTLSGGRYSVPVEMFQANNGASTCTLNDVIVTDGAGDVALYGTDFAAPAVHVVVTTTPDTTAPVATAASLSMASVPQSEIGNYSYGVDITVSDPSAPVDEAASYLYDSAGTVVGQAFGGANESSSGVVMMSLDVPYGLAVGTYTVGFSITDAGGLTNSYGTPGGKAVPGGALTFTVTAG